MLKKKKEKKLKDDGATTRVCVAAIRFNTADIDGDAKWYVGQRPSRATSDATLGVAVFRG